MQIKCPVCEKLLQVSDEKIRSHSCRCIYCGNDFFLAGDLPFRYGTPLPPSAKCKHRIECPYCHQHYNLTTQAMHNMLGCIKCLKIFIIPRSLRQLNDDALCRRDPENARSAINLSAATNRSGSIKVISFPGKSETNPETLVPEALDENGNPIQILRQKQGKISDIALSGHDRNDNEKLMQRFEEASSLFPGPSESAVQKEMQPEFPAASVEQMKISEEIFASAPTTVEPFPARKTDSVSARIPPPPAPAKINQPQEQKFPENLRIIRKEEPLEKVSIKKPAPADKLSVDIFMEENSAFSAGENNASSSTEKGVPDWKPAGDKSTNKNIPSDDDKAKIRRIAGNVLWLFCGGLTSAIITTIQGGILCITIIGIPFGLQLFKAAKLYLSPFGAQICNKNEEGTGCLATGGNILWILLGGWLTALLNLLFGAILFCTVIGIPFAFQYFKFAKLILSPFGKEVRTKACGKELLICILVVFLLQYVLIPIITSKIRNSINNAIIENMQNSSGAKNASPGGKSPDAIGI